MFRVLRALAAGFAACILAACAPGAGDVLPAWHPGLLDIHAVNSARGECSFIVLPDGTTMCIDAGEFYDYVPSKYAKVEARPDSATRPYMVYADYMRYFKPGIDSLDLFVLTHYHMDHMGDVEKCYARDPEGGYVLGGVTALYGEIPFRRLIDRASNNLDSCRIGNTSGSFGNYCDFVRWASATRGLRVEAMEVGSSTQIAPVHSGKYPVRVVNYAANGMVLGADGSVEDVYCGKPLRENGASCCILLSYGDFDYYTGGDAGGNSPVEVPVARSIGRPIEALKSNHHLSVNTMQDETMEILQPQVVVTQSFFRREVQPHREIMARILDRWAPDMFFTNISEDIQAGDPELYQRCAAIGGHVVIRVARGGRSFRVYMLDDTDPEYRIRSVHGPYRCR